MNAIATSSMTIDGQSVELGERMTVINPATEEPLATVPCADGAMLDRAVAAARRAFAGWRAQSHEERSRLVRQIGDVIRDNLEDLAHSLTAEQGKPLGDARQELQAAAYWCGAIADQNLPVLVHQDDAERYSETRHVPLGVVAGIVPWNFPISLAIWKVAPALLTGNTMVLKPSPFTPLTTLRLGELLRPVLPPGVLNTISGGDELGPLITTHPGIDKVSFTGSTNTGRKVMASAATNLKRLTLELGGNDPAIVMPDVDVPRVAEAVFGAAFRNSGQICIATKRLYVHADIYDQFREELVRLAATSVMGAGSMPGVTFGPIQNRPQYERVKALVADTVAAGHRIAFSGTAPQERGFFVPVTIVDNPPEDSRVVQEEAFGPVLPMLKFETIDEVIDRANGSEYGLAASVWSQDEAVARAIAERLECGTVWVNEVHHIVPNAPFSGHKQSGLGVENGLEGLAEYTNLQTITYRRA